MLENSTYASHWAVCCVLSMWEYAISSADTLARSSWIRHAFNISIDVFDVCCNTDLSS